MDDCQIVGAFVVIKSINITLNAHSYTYIWFGIYVNKVKYVYTKYISTVQEAQKSCNRLDGPFHE